MDEGPLAGCWSSVGLGLSLASLSPISQEGPSSTAGKELLNGALCDGALGLALSDQCTSEMETTFDIKADVFEELTVGFAVSW